jgi:hypothetical protein
VIITPFPASSQDKFSRRPRKLTTKCGIQDLHDLCLMYVGIFCQPRASAVLSLKSWKRHKEGSADYRSWKEVSPGSSPDAQMFPTFGRGTVRTAIISIHDELVATGTAGSEPQPPTAPEGRADHRVKTSRRGLTMEQQLKEKEEDGEKKTPSRCKILPFAGKMRANGLEGLR